MSNPEIQMRRGRKKGSADHGTDSGYYRHLRDSRWPPPCLECTNAHAAAEMTRKQRKKSKS